MQLKSALYEMRLESQKDIDKHCAFQYGLLRVMMIVSSTSDYDEVLDAIDNFYDDCIISYSENEYNMAAFQTIQRLLDHILYHLEHTEPTDLPSFQRLLIKIYNYETKEEAIQKKEEIHIS